MDPVAERDDRTGPSRHLGDYPDGAYWSAGAPDDCMQDEDVDDYSVSGADLRIMWDTGAGPLWTTEDGLLPNDPAWMERALGLSDSLVHELLVWLSDMDAADAAHRHVVDLDRRGTELAARLQAEVGARFKVRYHA